jgi:hypothetical protein
MKEIQHVTLVARSKKNDLVHEITNVKVGPNRVKKSGSTGEMLDIAEDLLIFACGMWGRKSSVDVLNVMDQTPVSCLNCLAKERYRDANGH